MAPAAPPARIWPQPIEIVGLTGEYASGKTLFALTIAPGSRTKIYDTEKSSGSYESLKFDRVSVPDEMARLKPSGYKPIDTFTWWWADVKATPPGKYDVIAIDTISEIEEGLVEWVGKNPTYFGHTSGQYLKMSGVMWGDVKNLWKAILSDLASRCQTFAFCSHMANIWQGDRPTGKRKPKGKETLMELASLYLLMERKPDAQGKVPAKPAATVLKSRLVHTQFDIEAGDVKLVPCLPPRIPVCTPAEIRKYMNAPPDYSALKPEEMVQEDKMSAEEREVMALQKAEAERDAERMKLERVAQQRDLLAQSQQTAAGAGITPPPPAGPTPEQLKTLVGLKAQLVAAGVDDAGWRAFFTPHGVEKARDLTPEQADAVVAAVQARVAELAPPAAADAA
jgi:hypothetical protein